MKIGQRIQLTPSTDLWARGARFGEIVGFRPDGLVRVKMDWKNKVIKVHPDFIMEVFDGDKATS